MRKFTESAACLAFFLAWSVAFGVSVEWLVVGEAMPDWVYTGSIAFALTGAIGAWYALDILWMNIETYRSGAYS